MAGWAVEAGRYEHGTRAKRQLEGCRCLLYRAANSNYETERQRRKREGTWQPYASPVEIAEVLRHIARLRDGGIGMKQIAVAAGLNRKVVQELVYPERRPQRGRPPRRRPRRETVQKILAVTLTLRDRAGAAYVSAAKTWRRIDILRSAGYTKTRLATMLGYSQPAKIQFRKNRVLVRNARRVATLFNHLWLADPRVRAAAGVRMSRRRRPGSTSPRPGGECRRLQSQHEPGSDKSRSQ